MVDVIKHNLKFDGELKKRTSTDYIIFHHTESKFGTVEDIHQWHKEREWIGIGYNLVVYKDGAIHEGRPIDCADADAYGFNNNSISVAFVGDFDNEYMTEAQVRTGIEILREVHKQYPKIIPYRHRDVNDTRCPGENFRNDIIFEGMKEVVIVTAPDAITKLVEAKVIASPDYWLKVIDTTKNIDQLLINMAQYTENHK